MMKKVFTFSLLFCLTVVCAQPPKRFFTKFGGNGDDIGYSAKVTLDKQYIIAGVTSSSGNGNTDVMLAKMDTMGQVIWFKTYGGFSNDIGKSVIQLADGSYVIAGFTNSFGAGGYDAYLIKTDASGTLLWQTTFGGDDWDFANDLVEAADGSIWVIGNTSSFGNGKKDGFVLKYDVAGNLQWQKYLGGAENEELRAVIKTNDNLIATVGYTESRGDLNGDGYFAKLNLNGDTLFTRLIGGPYKDYLTDLCQKTSGEYVISGAKTYTAGTKTRSLMYCMTAVGTFSWENNYYASSGDEEFVSVTNSFQFDYLSGFLRNVPVPVVGIQGNIFVATPGGYNYKVNSFGGYDWEWFYSIEGTADGGFLIVGETTSFGSVGKDVFVMKHDSTCYNYTSIVSVEEHSAGEQILPFVTVQDQRLMVCHPISDMPAFVEIVDPTGKLLLRKEVNSNKTVIYTEALYNSLLFVRSVYPDGRVYCNKVVSP